MKHTRFRSAALYILVILALLWGLTLFTGSRKDYVSYSTVRSCFQREQVVRFSVDGGGVLSMELKDGSVRRHALADVDAFRQELGSLYAQQYERGVLKSYDFQQRYEMPLLSLIHI